MNENKLKSCPFCFSDDLIITNTLIRDSELIELCNSNKNYFVFCNCCAAIGPATIKKSRAIKDWNERPAENYLVDCIRGIK